MRFAPFLFVKEQKSPGWATALGGLPHGGKPNKRQLLTKETGLAADGQSEG